MLMFYEQMCISFLVQILRIQISNKQQKNKELHVQNHTKCHHQQQKPTAAKVHYSIIRFYFTNEFVILFFIIRFDINNGTKETVTKLLQSQNVCTNPREANWRQYTNGKSREKNGVFCILNASVCVVYAVWQLYDGDGISQVWSYGVYVRVSFFFGTFLCFFMKSDFVG